MQRNLWPGGNPGNSWAANRNATVADYMTAHELISQIVQTVSCGGNVLVNVGPTADGYISALQEERLRQMGAWLRVNGEAIYGSSPWTYQNETRAQTCTPRRAAWCTPCSRSGLAAATSCFPSRAPMRAPERCCWAPRTCLLSLWP